MKPELLFALTLVVAGLSAAPTHAHDGTSPAAVADPRALDQAVARHMEEGGIVGVGAAIVVDGKVVWTKGYGFAGRAEAVPFTPDTVMNIGSISKTVTGAAMLRAVVFDLSRFVDAPSFVRSFAYASGPAYGLLLDDADPTWRRKLDADANLGALLAKAYRVDASASVDLDARKRRYDNDGSLRAAEGRRDRERMARVDAYRAVLVDGPVLVLPLAKTSFQFNPQTLVALESTGTVYPTLRLIDAWGDLVVERNGALVYADKTRATVPLRGNGSDPLRGDGWTLTLKPGWKIAPGARPGDSILVRETGQP